MAKHYRAVPLDEENSRSSDEATLYEKGGVTINLDDDRLENDLRTKVLDFVYDHWSWIGHVVLLTMSMSLFMLSFCNRASKPTDLQITQKISTYCMPGT